MRSPLQWRDRAGFQPASLLSLATPVRRYAVLRKSIKQGYYTITEGNCQSASIIFRVPVHVIETTKRAEALGTAIPVHAAMIDGRKAVVDR